MRAVRVQEYGGPEVLKVDEVEIPKPGPGQALIKVRFAGVNFIDIYQRVGRYQLPSLPCTLGREGCGTVESVGDGVTEVRVGERVGWAGSQGSYAEYLVHPADQTVPVPDGVDDQIAGGLPLQGMTAHYLLTSIHETRPGDWVLIHAAAGGVGNLAVQIAKLKGAKVIATVGSESKAAVARKAGADHVVNYSEQDFVAVAKELTGGRGVDAVLDGVGKATFAQSMQATRPRGRVVIFGAASGVADPISPNVLQNPSLTISGGSLAFFTATREELLWRSNEAFGWVTSGKLKPLIGEVLPLEKAADAQRMLAARETVGKVLLEVR